MGLFSSMLNKNCVRKEGEAPTAGCSIGEFNQRQERERERDCSHVTESCAPQNQKLKRNFLSPSQLLDSEQDQVAKP